MADNYVYAVARIRSLETALFTESVIRQLLACQTYEDALDFLAEKGWGDSGTGRDAGRMLKRETEKTWEVIRDLKVDPSVLEILSYPHLYHNLKAAVKEVCAGKANAEIYYDDTSVSGETMREILQEKDFSALPEHMRQAAAEALETMLQARDGQLCDIIVDRAALDAVGQAGRRSGEEVIRAYAEDFVATADIRIAIRGARTGKSRAFLERALAPCRAVSVSALMTAALSGVEAVCAALVQEGFQEAVDAWNESGSAFERWCDNRIIRTIRPQKYRAFSAGPLAAYVLARENEIKNVRMILTGKQNGLPDAVIRERVREMYV